jgi:hypothetical protein
MNENINENIKGSQTKAVEDAGHSIITIVIFNH